MSVNHLHIRKTDDGAGFHVRCACGIEATLRPAVIGREVVSARRQLKDFEQAHFPCRHRAKHKTSPETLDLGPAALPAGGA